MLSGPFASVNKLRYKRKFFKVEAVRLGKKLAKYVKKKYVIRQSLLKYSSFF